MFLCEEVVCAARAGGGFIPGQRHFCFGGGVGRDAVGGPVSSVCFVLPGGVLYTFLLGSSHGAFPQARAIA